MSDKIRPATSQAAFDIETLIEPVRSEFIAKHEAREAALPLCRETIRLCANAIRAVHRLEFDRAQELLTRAGRLLDEISDTLKGHADVYHAGFVHDAQKEYAEGRLTLAFVSGRELPSLADLSIGAAAFVNGLAEAATELRRHILDILRRGEVARCEMLLAAMEEVYSALVTIDYPDAITGGLRRATDTVRGVLEKTRGDLTVAVRQRELERRLDELSRRL